MALIPMKAESLVQEITTPRAVRVAARAPRWVVPLVKSSLMVADIALTSLSFLAAFYVRHYNSIVQRTASGRLNCRCGGVRCGCFIRNLR